MSGIDWGHAADVVATGAIVVGALLNLTTAIGVLRLGDLFSRQHAAAKPQVLGVLLMLLGVGLSLRETQSTVMLLLVAVFQLVTVPASAHMVTRAGYRGYVRRPAEDSASARPPEAATTTTPPHAVRTRPGDESH